MKGWIQLPMVNENANAGCILVQKCSRLQVLRKTVRFCCRENGVVDNFISVRHRICILPRVRYVILNVGHPWFAIACTQTHEALRHTTTNKETNTLDGWKRDVYCSFLKSLIEKAERASSQCDVVTRTKKHSR